MQQTDKALSDFNAWWDRQPFRDQFEDMKQQMANVWVASRADLVIELPEERSGPTTYLDDDARDEGWNDCLKECREAIEAAGGKVKE